MIEIILSGFGMGLLLALMIGPVFFALIQDSIHKGSKAGIIMAGGIVMSDAAYVLITNLGLRQFIDRPAFSDFLGIVGGIILIAFGIYNFSKALPNPGKPIHISWRSMALEQWSKGFLLNSLNPFVLLFWVGVVGLVTVERGYSETDKLIFFGSLLSTVFLTDLIKVIAAGQLRGFFQPRVIRILNRGVGIALILFGLRLLRFVVLA